MKELIMKFTSRKFLVSAAGVISGAVLIACGNITEGATALVASVIAYLAAEGIIDAAAVKEKAAKISGSFDEKEGE